MGCDIHNIVEVKRNGVWTAEPNPLVKCWSCNGTGKLGIDAYGNECAPKAKGERCTWCEGSGKERQEFYHGRNYDLFSILANVRNGTGFAGCRTGEGFRPIAMPKGWPSDTSKEAQAFRWEDDGHSYTWLTLREILDYDWSQVTVKEGIVSAAEYKKWAASEDPRHTYPEAWCGGVGGPNVKHISVIEMAEYVKRPDANLNPKWGEDSHYTTIRWEATYRRAAGERWWETVTLLTNLGDPDDVRILMFFDN